MKNILYFMMFLVAFAMFISFGNEIANAVPDSQLMRDETVVGKDFAKEAQKQVEILCRDMRSNNFLAPQRSFQFGGNTLLVRSSRSMVKISHFIIKQKTDRLLKISTDVLADRLSNFYSLLCRSGYHIFALRKIII